MEAQPQHVPLGPMTGGLTIAAMAWSSLRSIRPFVVAAAACLAALAGDQTAAGAKSSNWLELDWQARGINLQNEGIDYRPGEGAWSEGHRVRDRTRSWDDDTQPDEGWLLVDPWPNDDRQAHSAMAGALFGEDPSPLSSDEGSMADKDPALPHSEPGQASHEETDGCASVASRGDESCLSWSSTESLTRDGLVWPWDD